MPTSIHALKTPRLALTSVPTDATKAKYKRIIPCFCETNNQINLVLVQVETKCVVSFGENVYMTLPVLESLFVASLDRTLT